MPKFEPISLVKDSESPNIGLNQPESPVTAGLNLYITNPRVLELPEEGYITFRFTRGKVRIVEGDDNRESEASVDLTVTEICDVKADEGPEEKVHERAENAIDELFSQLRGKSEAEVE